MEYKLHIVEMPSLMEGGKITNVRYSKTVLRLDSSEILHRCGETALKGWEEGIDLVYLLTCSFQSFVWAGICPCRTVCTGEEESF